MPLKGLSFQWFNKLNLSKKNNLITMNKYLTVFIFFAFFSLAILFTIRNEKKTDEITQNFYVEIKGIIIEKRNLDHDDAYCKILVTQSNKKLYKGKGIFGGTTKLNNNIAEIRLVHSHCLQIGDTVMIGPNNNFIIKSGNDTLFILGIMDKCFENGRK
jgi:uncharacterized membrane protein